MRGVISAGMVLALEHFSLLPTFDAVYGSSAGAFNGAYFVAGQAHYGTTIYYENINNSSFINMFRTFSSRPVMSLEFLLDQVASQEKVLDCGAVITSPVPLKIVASSVKRQQPVLLSGFTSPVELLRALKASACLPFVAGTPVAIGEDHYLDASVFEPLPHRTAIGDGCTHVLVLQTRPVGKLRSAPSFVERRVIAPWLARLDKRLGDTYLQRAEIYADRVAEVTRATIKPTGTPYLMGLAVAASVPAVSQLEKRRARLVSAAAAGMSAVVEALTDRRPVPVEVLTPYDPSGHVATLQ